MSRLLATTLTLLAASGCAASTPADDEPPASSHPIPHVGSAAASTSENEFEAGSVRFGTDQRLERGVSGALSGPPIVKTDPISTSDLVFNPPTGLSADVEPH
jgi:hypothetical protein